MLEWGALFADLDYRIVADDTVLLPGEVFAFVRTVWNGTVDVVLDDRLFSTAYKIHDGLWSTVERYDTEEEAVTGHRDVVQRIASPTVGRHHWQDAPMA